MDKFDAMTRLYTAWIEQEGLPLVSADEQIMENLTGEQQEVIKHFSDTWNLIGQED
jgi:hypothetical protein